MIMKKLIAKKESSPNMHINPHSNDLQFHPLTSRSNLRTNMYKSLRNRSLAAAGLAITACFVPASSQAMQLTYEIRVNPVGTSAGVTIAPDFKSAVANAPGDVIALSLFAILNNANGNNADDGLTQTNGSFTSNNGGLQGNLRGDTNFVAGGNTQQNNVAGFQAGVSQSGFSFNNIDGDGDLDVGSLVQTGSFNPAPWFIAVGGTGAGGTTFGTGATTSATTLLIGATTFTLGASALANQSTLVNYVPRIKTDGTIGQRNLHKFVLDGAIVSLAGNDANLAVGTPVTLSLIPEPSAFGMVLLGAMGLVGFRRYGGKRR